MSAPPRAGGPEMPNAQSMYPFDAPKKNCTAHDASKSLSASGSEGTAVSSAGRATVAANVPAASFTSTLDSINRSDAGRSGVLKYSYPLIVIRLCTSPSVPSFRSYTENATKLPEGKPVLASIASPQPYAARRVSRASPAQAAGSVTVSPKHAQPAA